jgi:hypothetical protein
MLQAIHRNVEGGVQPRSQRSRKAEAEAGRIVTQSSNGCTSTLFAPSTMRILDRPPLVDDVKRQFLRTAEILIEDTYYGALSQLSKGKLVLDCGRPSLIASLPGLSGDLPTGVTSKTVQAKILSRIDRATSWDPVRPSNFLTHPMPLSRSARRHTQAFGFDQRITSRRLSALRRLSEWAFAGCPLRTKGLNRSRGSSPRRATEPTR